MTRYLSLSEVIALHGKVIDRSGGARGVRDIGALQSSTGQPCATFSRQDLYPTLIDQAAILGFLLIMNHPLIGGNKRAGHAAIQQLGTRLIPLKKYTP